VCNLLKCNVLKVREQSSFLIKSGKHVQKVAKAPAKQRAAGKSKTGRSKASAKVPTYQAHLVTACLVFSPC
jgi:hypothetical protein